MSLVLSIQIHIEDGEKVPGRREVMATSGIVFNPTPKQLRIVGLSPAAILRPT